MGSRGVLTKNYFIYPETLAEYGAEIERVMTETDRAMEEASEIIAKMASVTERIPSQIRSWELLELCETAQAEIRSFDFLSYGKRVNQGLLNLLDQNQYITDNFIKKMEATTERMREFGAGCRRLTELIDYSGGSLPLKGLALAAVSNVENENTNDIREIKGLTSEGNIPKDNLQNTLRNYLIAHNITNSIEQQTIIDMITEDQDQMLIDLYITDCYSTADARVIFGNIMNYYENNIAIDTIVENFLSMVSDSENINYQDIYSYLEYLEKLHVICQVDYDFLNNAFWNLKQNESTNCNEIKKFFSERMELINNLTDKEWTRYEIMCALMIEATLFEQDFSKELISAFIGNMKREGVCGEFENANYTKNEPPYYLVHVMEEINYLEVYSNRNITEIDLMQLYYDMVLICDDEEHSFGIGAFQWTFDRNIPLLELYFEEIGYSVNSEDFENKLQDYFDNGKSNTYEGLFITEEQVQNAEMKWLTQELQGAFNDVKEDCYIGLTGNETSEEMINHLVIQVKQLYEQNYDENDLPNRQEAANNWYNYRYN